jgi:effector-binding domain-containing protein
VEVVKFEDIAKDIVTITRYAIANFQGSNQQIFEAYDELHQWVEYNSHKRLKTPNTSRFSSLGKTRITLR